MSGARLQGARHLHRRGGTSLQSTADEIRRRVALGETWVGRGGFDWVLRGWGFEQFYFFVLRCEFFRFLEHCFKVIILFFYMWIWKVSLNHFFVILVLERFPSEVFILLEVLVLVRFSRVSLVFFP